MKRADFDKLGFAPKRLAVLLTMPEWEAHGNEQEVVVTAGAARMPFYFRPNMPVVELLIEAKLAAWGTIGQINELRGGSLLPTPLLKSLIKESDRKAERDYQAPFLPTLRKYKSAVRMRLSEWTRTIVAHPELVDEMLNPTSSRGQKRAETMATKELTKDAIVEQLKTKPLAKALAFALENAGNESGVSASIAELEKQRDKASGKVRQRYESAIDELTAAEEESNEPVYKLFAEAVVAAAGKSVPLSVGSGGKSKPSGSTGGSRVRLSDEERTALETAVESILKHGGKEGVQKQQIQDKLVGQSVKFSAKSFEDALGKVGKSNGSRGLAARYMLA